MRPCPDFATETRPLRASALPLLVKCPFRAAMLHLHLFDDESGAAADTGSAVHAAIQAWHTNGNDEAAALAAMRKEAAKYPLADFHDAHLHLAPYFRDPRNRQAEVVAVEKRVAFTLAPAKGDKKKIHVRGTLDQIRRVNGELYLFDVKTGQSEGWDMLHDYLYQVVAYCVGAAEELGEPVHPGALIRTRGYRKRGTLPDDPPGVFWNYAIRYQDCDRLLDAVRHAVALVRKGYYHLGPGKHCSYCPARGIDTCAPQLLSL